MSGALLGQIAVYLARTGMSSATFGRTVMGYPSFVRELRLGRTARPETEARVLAWMQDNPTYERVERQKSLPSRFPKLDPFTSDTLRSMLGYVADDGRIARHLGIDERQVRLARTARPSRAA